MPGAPAPFKPAQAPDNLPSIQLPRFARLPRNVLALGWVSLLTDLSSEMIFPLLPMFLTTTLGAGALVLGLIEGIAESTASTLKIASGIWTDRTRRRKPLIAFGYGLSGAVRPLIGFATGWTLVLALRFADRIGKGLRSSARDALIADSVDSRSRGAAYGFHRMMDHGGAVLGPLAAAALLSLPGVTLRHVFFAAAIPAFVVMVVLVLAVREPEPTAADPAPSAPLPFGWRELPADFRRVLLALGVFTLGNSSDAFILLRLNESGVGAAWIALLWSAHHVLKMGASVAGGSLSDRIGRRPLVLAGWAWFALIYAAFAWLQSPGALVAVFLLYGLYFGMVEPTERAWIVDIVPARLRGTGLGLYHGVVGLTALPASVLFGAIWKLAGAPAAFTLGAALAAAASLLLLTVRPSDLTSDGRGTVG